VGNRQSIQRAKKPASFIVKRSATEDGAELEVTLEKNVGLTNTEFMCVCAHIRKNILPGTRSEFCGRAGGVCSIVKLSDSNMRVCV